MGLGQSHLKAVRPRKAIAARQRGKPLATEPEWTGEQERNSSTERP